MKIQEALQTFKNVKRSKYTGCAVRYFRGKEGPHADLVDCSYFMIKEDGDDSWYFSTSIDLYPEDILADDWEIVK